MSGQPPEAAREFLLELRELENEVHQSEGLGAEELSAEEAKTCFPNKVFDKLQDFVATAKFLDKLEAGADGMSPELSTGLCPTQPSQGLDDFVLVEKDDAIEALAYYIAACVAKAPEAQSLSPAELQRMIGATFKGLKKSRFQLAWHHGRRLYRCAAVGYSVFQLYENPWLMRAIATAVWAFFRFSFGLPVILPYPSLGLL